MATIIDSLAIELSLDPKKLQEGLKTVGNQVKESRDESERHFKALDGLITSLGRGLGGLVAGFLSLEAAIKAFAASRDISRTGTEFGNLAETIGMSVTQLGAWENALARVGGNAQELGHTFLFQQRELQRTKLEGGAPSFLWAMQRLGLPDWNKYYNEATGAFDIDKLNKDIADAFGRVGLAGKEHAPERAAILRAFGVEDAAGQRLYEGDLRQRLEQGRRVAPTAQNEAAFRKLNELWSTLGQTLDAIKNDLVTNFYDPLAKVLSTINHALETIHTQGWMGYLQQLAKELKEEGVIGFLFNPHISGAPQPASPSGGIVGGAQAAPAAAPTVPSPHTGVIPRPMSQTSQGMPATSTGLPPPGPMTGTGGVPAPTGFAPLNAPWATPSAPPQYGTPPPSTETPGQAIMVGPRVGRTSVPPVPYTSPTQPQNPPAPSPLPQLPKSESQLDRLQSLSMLTGVVVEPSTPTTTYNSNINTTIGGISFQGTGTQQTGIDNAGPYAGIDRNIFSDAAYAVQADTALE